MCEWHLWAPLLIVAKMLSIAVRKRACAAGGRGGCDFFRIGHTVQCEGQGKGDNRYVNLTRAPLQEFDEMLINSMKKRIQRSDGKPISAWRCVALLCLRICVCYCRTLPQEYRYNCIACMLSAPCRLALFHTDAVVIEWSVQCVAALPVWRNSNHGSAQRDVTHEQRVVILCLVLRYRSFIFEEYCWPLLLLQNKSVQYRYLSS